MDHKVTLLVLLTTLSFIRAKDHTYEFLFSDEDLFSACSDAAPGTLDINGFVDLSEFSKTLQEDGVLLSGNMTSVWDTQPQDHVKAFIKLFYFDRGTWIPTFYSVTSNDFCKSMYDSKSPWNLYCFQHLTNFEDVKDKCVSPGTKLIFETYLLTATMSVGKLREGLYKVECTYKAFDANGTERPTSICFELLGNIQKV